MLNKKGQSLVAFVLLLPIILLIFIMVKDIGTLSLTKNELNNINEIALNYGLDNLNNPQKIENLIIKNDKNIKITKIETSEDKLYIEIEKKINLTLLKNIINVKSAYQGYYLDNKKVFERK